MEFPDALFAFLVHQTAWPAPDQVAQLIPDETREISAAIVYFLEDEWLLACLWLLNSLHLLQTRHRTRA